MAAPKGNKFWLNRTKHGRNKLFSSPVVLWKAACEYFDWCHDNPLQVQDWVGRNGDEVYKNLMRPFTWSGLAVFFDCEERTLRYYGNDESHKDFFPVIAKIDQIIKTQKFEGAAVGLFNSNIIARDLGLRDNQDVTTNGESVNFDITLKLDK